MDAPVLTSLAQARQSFTSTQSSWSLALGSYLFIPTSIDGHSQEFNNSIFRKTASILPTILIAFRREKLALIILIEGAAEAPTLKINN